MLITLIRIATLSPAKQCVLDETELTFTCETDSSLLTWIDESSNQKSYTTSSALNVSAQLDIFTVQLTMINGNILTSTATVNVSSLINITTLRISCGDGLNREDALLINGRVYRLDRLIHQRVRVFVLSLALQRATLTSLHCYVVYTNNYYRPITTFVFLHCM